MNDTELIDWLEKQEGVGLIGDDRGNWAVSTWGFQNIEEGSHPIDIDSHFLVEQSKWKTSIRAAILAYKEEAP